MKVKFHNVIVFAENYESLINWYQKALGLTITMQNIGDYNYTELGFDSEIIVGITPATEMEHTPSAKRNNSTILQIATTDIEALFNKVKAENGKILFGINVEEKANFKYGGIADLEGNQIWVFEENFVD